MRKLIYVLMLVPFAIMHAADNPIRDGNFQSAGQPNSVWQTKVEKDGAVEAAKDASGTGPALRLKSARVMQDVHLPEGLFEFTAQAYGQGELTLRVENIGERTQALGKEQGLYGYLFESKAGPTKATIGIRGDGHVTAVSIQPANEEQKAVWKKAQESLRQFGFMTVSPQRPTPGTASLRFDGEVKPLAGMTKRAVLDEPRMNTGHVANEMRLVEWLGKNSFERLDAEKLGQWMDARIKKPDAYGSVVVLCRGNGPANLLEGPTGEPLWLQYLRAGGRIVNVGDLPFYNIEQPMVKPPIANPESRGMGLLGLECGWHMPYWGQGNLAVTPTPSAKAWGIELVDGPITGFSVENVSLAFGVYTVPATGKQGASSWFKNVRPDMPWSGLIKMQQDFNGNNDVALRDIWRATHYVGQPLEIPPLPPPLQPPAEPMKVVLRAGEMEGRREWVRGEKVRITVTPEATLGATAVRYELLQGVAVLVKEEQPFASGAAVFELDTQPWAYGAYQLRVTAAKGKETVATISEKVGIRYISSEAFNWEIWHCAGTNLLRADLEFADIAAAGLELYLVDAGVGSVDAAVRNGLGFSLRAHPDFSGGKTWDFAKEPEYFRIDNEGKPIGTAYSGGRPSLGISHPEIRRNATKSMRKAVEPVAKNPAFRPYVLCNDDFSIYYGWDYAPHVREAFKKDTGLDAPRKMELPAKPGAIPDNNPWVRWFEWTLIDVNGAFNQAETEGVVQARADARIGPIPGGMQIPLVQLWEPAQYPPYNFGKNGFNLLCSYYYNTYWQPVMTVTFWMEIGRMGNRDLPEWNMPDAFMTAAYTRNNLFHYFAGGVKGLAYFTYSSRNDNTWPEFHRLGKMVRRIGPVQAQLKPAKRDIGFLNSFTSNCFDAGFTLVQVYAYLNLMQGHFDVDLVSEDEILDGRADQYQAILLYNVKYLRQSVHDKLAAHAAKGGLVILDATVPFDIPGAKRLNVDLGMGQQHTQPFPPEGAHLSVPGIRDYGFAERVAVIKKSLSQYVQPRFESDDIKLAATRFEAGGVPYTWFVNVHDGKEYMFCRERMGAGHPGAGTPEKVKEVRDWENAETSKGPYVSTFTMENLPGVPYDLVAMKPVPVVRPKNGPCQLTLSMERFGGALVAWLPEEIAALKLDAPRTARPQATVKASATLHGKGSFLGLRAGRKIPGALPVEFVLKDPQGQVHVVSGVRASRDGAAAWEWTPATNDPPGKWTLTATDLTSGKTSERRISLGR